MGDQHPTRRDTSLSGLPPTRAVLGICFPCRTAARLRCGHRILARNPSRTKQRAVNRNVWLHRRDERALGTGIYVCDLPAGNRLGGAERMRTIALTWLLMTATAGAALAHAGEPHGTGAAWTFDPWIVGPLLAVGVPYLVGTWKLQERTTIGPPARALSAVTFCLGWATLAGALMSPLHWLGEHLFTFHMIEHEIVMAVSAPLLIAARPIGTMLWALPRSIRIAAGRMLRRRSMVNAWEWLSAGGNATVLHGIAIWAWHAPVLFDAAVTNVAMHRLQHLSFLLTAMLFWWSVVYRSNAGLAPWHLFLTMMHTSILGALMALSPKVLYQAQTATAAEWGLTPLQDQQLAGLIMWIPAGTVYAGAAMALTVIWIRKSGEVRRRSDAVRAV